MTQRIYFTATTENKTKTKVVSQFQLAVGTRELLNCASFENMALSI